MTLVSNGGTTTLGLYDAQSQLEKKADITYVDNKVDPLIGGHKGFATLALAQAAQGTLPSGSVVEVTNDATVSNNGLYLWNGTTLTKSAYDPLAQAKTYTDNKLDFIVGLPENNRFVKELYVTGWNGTDNLYLSTFNGNDNGKVTFNFYSNSQIKIYTFQKAQGLQIYPLETSGGAAGSGFGGYILIDWNAYTASIANIDSAKYTVSRKALNLVNCPFIKEYIDVNPLTVSVATNTDDITNLKQRGAYDKTLAATATISKADLINNLIPDIKLLSGHVAGYTYYINDVSLISGGIRINLRYLSPPSTTNWALYNVDILQGSEKLAIYEKPYNNFYWRITVDWNYLSQLTASITGGSQTISPLNQERLFSNDLTSVLQSTPSFYKIGNVIKDGQSKSASFLTPFVFSANGDANYSHTETQVADGTRIVLSNTNANVSRRFGYELSPIYARMQNDYFIYVKFTVNSFSGTSNQFSADISRSAAGLISSGNMFDNIVAGKTYEEVRKIPKSLTATSYTDARFILNFFSSNNSAAGTVLDITIHDIRLIYNYAQDPIFINKERKEVEQLVRAVGYFESEITIPKFVDTALQLQTINKGLEMQSLGDSTSVMVMWQERLAQMKGWHFNRTMAINGLNGGYPVALGGSWCEPIISNFGATGNAGQNHYTRSTSIVDYGIDVLFVLSSYNGQHPGKAWQTGGQLVKADHGINDGPYLGSEVNLITNPTADFPSFGASYYGMIEKLMTANPTTRIVLLTLYTFSATGSSLNNILVKNAVIRKAAEKYGLQLIDLEKISGINSFTAPTLCFDGGVHINQAGGDRLAQVIGGLV